MIEHEPPDPEKETGALCEKGAGDYEVGKPETKASADSGTFNRQDPEEFPTMGELLKLAKDDERRTFALRHAVINTILLRDERSFSAIARQHDVSPAAISKIHIRLIDGLGFTSLFRSLTTRRANALAAARQHETRRHKESHA